MTAPLTAGRRATLVFGLPVSLAFVGWGSLSLVGVMGLHAYTETRTVTPSSTVLTVENGGGSIGLTQSSDGLLHVVSTGHETMSRPHLSVTQTSAGITVTASCPGFSIVVCDVNLSLSVPPGFTVTAGSGGGDVHTASFSATSLTLSSSAGDVHALGVSATVVKASSSAGDVTVGFAVPPTTVTATSSAGDVTVRVPGSASYRVEASTSAGDTHVRVHRDDASAHAISAHSSAGDVTVEPAG